MIAGIDVGGTKVLMALCNDDGSILWQHQVPSQADEPPLRQLEAYARELQRVAQQKGHPVHTVGVSLPGPVKDGKRLVVAPNLGWHDLDLPDTLSGLPSSFDQDARCATRAEARFGAGVGVDSFIYVSVGTGLGAGLWLGGDVWRGAGGSAGEIGHIKLPGSTAPCGCGQAGCLERTASGHGIERLYQERTGTHLAGTQIFEKAEQEDDADALAVIASFTDALGWGFALLAGLFNPQRLVLGGGFVQRFEELKPKLWRLIAKETMPPSQNGLDLVAAKLGPESAAVGAALLGGRRR